MPNEFERQRQKVKEQVRWRLLRFGSMGGKIGCTDSMALRVIADEIPGVVRDRIQEELLYLEDKDLVKVKKSATDWRYTLTSEGIDVVDGNIECPVGIAKPDWE